jgi:hypothetical protein
VSQYVWCQAHLGTCDQILLPVGVSKSKLLYDWQSVSQSSHWAPFRTCDQILLPVRMLLLYKNAIRTSQETHYASATEPNLLMLFRWKPCLLWGEVTLRLTVSLGIEHPCGTCDQILLPVQMSKLLYHSQSVSQYVLVSSTLVGLVTRYYFLSECRSRSYFTTDSQSVSLGIEHPWGTCDQILLPVRMLLLYKNAICTSQEKPYASATEPNLLMLFGGKPAVYCEVRLLYNWQSVSESVCLGIEHPLGLATRYYFLSEFRCVVSVRRPLWREVGSVSDCQQ